MTAVVEGSRTATERTVSVLLGEGVGAGAVVCVAMHDGPQTGWLAVEDPEVDDRRCAVVALSGSPVLQAGRVAEVTVIGTPVPTADAMPSWAWEIAAATWQAQRRREERDAAREEVTRAARQAAAEHEARLERIVDAAHEFADENSLCGRFDDFMTSQGLRPRTKDYDCTVDVTVRVRIRAEEATSAEAAASSVTDSQVAEALAALRGREFDEAIQDHDVTDTEEV